MKTVVVLNRDQMGHGDADLGMRILGAFLRKCLAMHELHAIVLYNSGVKLVADPSPLIPDFLQLFERGIEILPCGTCLDHYGLASRVSVASDMDSIIRELDAADKVITL